MQVTIRPEAEQDVEEAFAWYEKQRPGLGAEFFAEVRSTLVSIGGYPQQYPCIRDDVRRAVTSRFPFGVYYLVSVAEAKFWLMVHSGLDKTINAWPTPG